MATLWNRATPPQYRMLRAIAGAVRNAAHAHHLEMPKNFARSVAKRAVGTLTAQWPDVLAARNQRCQDGLRDRLVSRDPRGSYLSRGRSEGAGLRLLRLAPIRFVWKQYATEMWKVRREGTPAEYEVHVRVLRLLGEAQRELDKLADTNGDQQ